MFARISHSVKHSLIDYMDRVFAMHYNGEINLEEDLETPFRFSRRPRAIEIENWEVRQLSAYESQGQDRALKTVALSARYYPCILFGSVTGQFKKSSLTGLAPPRLATLENGNVSPAHQKLMAGKTPFGGFMGIDRTKDPAAVVVGGFAELVVQLTTVARTVEEADSLRDITGILLDHPWLYSLMWQKYGFYATDSPRLDGESSLEDPTTDFKVYERSLSLPVRGEWRDEVAHLAKIEKIVFGPTLIDP